MGLSSFPELPPELWTNILKHASRDVQRNCLLVSLTLHDLAVPFVFSRVVVQNCEIWDGLSPWSDEELLQYRAMKERSWNAVQEFLRHIIATPMIAHAIRSFWMQWNNDEMLESKDAQSESTLQAQGMWSNSLPTSRNVQLSLVVTSDHEHDSQRSWSKSA